MEDEKKTLTRLKKKIQREVKTVYSPSGLPIRVLNKTINISSSDLSKILVEEGVIKTEMNAKALIAWLYSSGLLSDLCASYEPTLGLDSDGKIVLFAKNPYSIDLFINAVNRLIELQEEHGWLGLVGMVYLEKRMQDLGESAACMPPEIAASLEEASKIVSAFLGHEIEPGDEELCILENNEELSSDDPFFSPSNPEWN